MLKACIGLNCARQIDFMERRSCQLSEVPDEIYRHEATLEDLALDSNMIQELPPKFFRMTNLVKLTLSENEIMRISPMIANFTRLLELDLSKNCLEELPSNIQFCRSLRVLDISCNPLLRIPDCVVSIATLTHLYLNDVALPALPQELGNLKNLTVFEARENVIRRIPPSIGDLTKLEKLDLGNNEIEELPPTFGYLENLIELWLDSNCLSLLPESLSRLKNLEILDVTKNKLERFPNHFANLINLADLHASENCIEALPENFGLMKGLVQIKLDLNHLIYLPDSIGKLTAVTEIFLFENMLESLPPSIFNIPTLEMLNVDRNHIMEIPQTICNCKSLHVLSIRENELFMLPEEIGSLESLRVLDVCGNRLSFLPITISNLQLDAFWISGSQLQPLVSLRQELDLNNPGKKVLTCSHFPQKGPEGDLDYMDNSDVESEESTNFPLRRQSANRHSTRLTVAFDPGTAGSQEDSGSKFVRFPTPFRKDLKNKHKRPKLDARPRTTVFKKGSMDDLTLHAVEVPNEVESDLPTDTQSQQSSTVSSSNQDNLQGGTNYISPMLKMQGVQNLSEGFLAENIAESDDNNTINESTTSSDQNTLPKSKLQTVDVTVTLMKDSVRGLGFSIAGGRGSTPAYEDVDESIFITRIIRGGPAEKDGQLRLGDKLISVNGQDMTDATHMQAVGALRGASAKCILQVSREVLIILPDTAATDESSSPIPPALPVRNSLQPISIATPPDDITPVPNITPVGSNEATPIPPDNNNEILIIEAETYEDKHHERSYSNEREATLLDDISPLDKQGGFVDNEIMMDEQHNNDDDDEDDHDDEDDDEEIRELADNMFSDHDDDSDSYINIEIAQSLMDEARAQEANAASSLAAAVAAQQQLQERFDRRGQSDSGHASPDINIEEVVILERQHPKLGMSIVGGINYVNKIFGLGLPGIYISKVSPGGSAAATGKLKLGDRILKVNGISVDGMTHEQAVDLILSLLQDGDIELLVRHEKQPDGLMKVIIERDNTKKLGITIKGGGPGYRGNPFDPKDDGIFISKVSNADVDGERLTIVIIPQITRGEAAEKNGQLRVGHRILEVNDLSLLGVSHIEAVHTLRSVGNSVALLVCNGYSFEDQLKHAQILQLRKPLTGSVDVLDSMEETRDKMKRAYSSASIDVNKRTDVQVIDTGSINLNEVLRELAQFNTEILQIENEKKMIEMISEEADDNDNSEQVSPTALESTSQEELAVTSSEKVKKRSEAQRRTSREVAKQRRQEKKEELKSIIDEVFTEIDIYTNEALPISQNERSLSESPLFSRDISLGNAPHHEKQRSQSTTETCDDIIMQPLEAIARPKSAEDRKGPPPTAPKPLAIISPEKLSFRDKLALHQKKANYSRNEEARKSWAPGMFPRSGSLSPVYNKWPSMDIANGDICITSSSEKENNNKSSVEQVISNEIVNSALSNENMNQRTRTDMSLIASPPLATDSPVSISDSPMSPPLNVLSPQDPGFSPPLEDDLAISPSSHQTNTSVIELSIDQQ